MVDDTTAMSARGSPEDNMGGASSDSLREYQASLAVAAFDATTRSRRAAGFTGEQWLVCSAEIMNLDAEPPEDTTIGKLTLSPVRRASRKRRQWSSDTEINHSAVATYAFLVPHWTDAVTQVYQQFFKPALGVVSLAQGRLPIVTNLTFSGRRYEFVAKGFQRVGASPERIYRHKRERVRANRLYEFCRLVLAGIDARSTSDRDRLYEALDWMNEPLIAAVTTLESQFLMTWFALNTVVRLENPVQPDPPLCDSEWRALQSVVKSWVTNELTDSAKREFVLSRLGEFNRSSERRWVESALDKLSIPYEGESVQSILRARNAVVHEPWDRHSDLEGAYRSVDRLAFQAISKSAGVDPTQFEPE